MMHADALFIVKLQRLSLMLVAAVAVKKKKRKKKITISCVQRWFLRTAFSTFAYLSDWTGSVGSSRVIQRVEGGFLLRVSCITDIVSLVRTRRWSGACLHPWRIFKRFTRSLPKRSFLDTCLSPLFSLLTVSLFSFFYSFCSEFLGLIAVDSRERIKVYVRVRRAGPKCANATWPMRSAE